MQTLRRAIITGSIGLIALAACGSDHSKGSTTPAQTPITTPTAAHAAAVEKDACGAIATFINSNLSQSAMNYVIGDSVKSVLERTTHADAAWSAAARRLLKATTSPHATAADAEPFMKLCGSNGRLTVGGN